MNLYTFPILRPRPQHFGNFLFNAYIQIPGRGKYSNTKHGTSRRGKPDVCTGLLLPAILERLQTKIQQYRPYRASNELEVPTQDLET